MRPQAKTDEFLNQWTEINGHVLSHQTGGVVSKICLIFTRIIQKMILIEAMTQAGALKEIKTEPCQNLADGFSKIKNHTIAQITTDDFFDTQEEPSLATLFEPFFETEVLQQNTRATLEKISKDQATAATSTPTSGHEALVTETLIRATHFHSKAVDTVTTGLLIVMGALLTVVTHGVCAAQGSAMITEGLSKLHELSSEKHGTKKALEILENNDFTKKEFKILSENQTDLSKDWSTVIKTHCDKQLTSLDLIKMHLEAHNDQKNLQDINSYTLFYTEQLASLKTKTKLEDIQSIAFTIQNKENDKIVPLANKLKKELPEAIHKPIDNLIAHAKHFYHENKKMFQLAGLIALAAVGIGLTVATGGVAGVLGAAALGVVIVSPIKSFLKQAKEKMSHLSAQVERLKTHVQQQYGTLSSIDKQISDPKTHQEIQEEKLAYQNERSNLEHMDKTPQALLQVAKEIEKTDRQSIETLQHAALPESAEKESKTFIERAKDFVKTNKSALRLASKAALGVTALTVLVVTGGTAAGVVAGLAVSAALISYAATHISQKIKSFRAQKSASVDQKEENASLLH